MLTFYIISPGSDAGRAVTVTVIASLANASEPAVVTALYLTSYVPAVNPVTVVLVIAVHAADGDTLYSNVLSTSLFIASRLSAPSCTYLS